MGLISKKMEEGENDPAGDPTTPDNTPAHENAESPELEQQEGSEEDGAGAAESDPSYQQAVELAHKALYADGAAEDLAKAIRAADDPIDELANAAYEIVSMIDEKSPVPDELLISFALEVMTEVAEVAQAAGIQIQGAQVSQAVKVMIKRYAAESGMDASQLEQAMGQVDDAQLGSALDQESGEEGPAPAAPSGLVASAAQQPQGA